MFIALQGDLGHYGVRRGELDPIRTQCRSGDKPVSKHFLDGFHELDSERAAETAIEGMQPIMKRYGQEKAM